MRELTVTEEQQVSGGLISGLLDLLGSVGPQATVSTQAAASTQTLLMTPAGTVGLLNQIVGGLNTNLG
jgi:hypothetical protein